ncbi:MAG: sucrose-6-phosphate hydrolase [Lachnospiraceae bacterium]|nr:sucrose-6-phosphate hydrolase [Lachnospiraceae bacterium]
MKEWTREEKYRRLQDPSEIEELHKRISRSPYRQVFHVQPVTGLLNDPNGFIFHNGVWHLFYQWCPWGAVHGMKHWYHVTSRDLVDWKNEGVAVRPDRDYDNYGAYSGSAYPTDGKVYLYYTGNHRDPDWKRSSYTNLVKLNDDGTIEKYEEPLFGPHPDYSEHQRDPKILRFENPKKYVILLGAQTKKQKGRILVYTSEHHNRGWSFSGELKVPGFENFGGMWECPSIEHIGDMDVLLFCPQHLFLSGHGEGTNHNGYILGHMNWDTLTFTPEGSFHVFDFGFDSYAAECATIVGEKDKAVLTAWMGLPDASYPVTDEEEWSGCLTLPRELRIRNRRLIQTPLPQLEKLRTEEVDPQLQKLPDACELDITFGPGSHQLNLFTDEQGRGGLQISYRGILQEILIDRSAMKNRFNQEFGELRSRPLPNGLQRLRIFIDRSSVEIFVNDGDAVFSSSIFPTEKEHYFRVDKTEAFRIWKLRSAVGDDFVV